MPPSTMPHGTWPSPLSAADLAGSTVGVSDLQVDGDRLCWIQTRPDDGGRYAVVRREADGTISEPGPADFNARTRVHEYGGGALGTGAGIVLASSWADSRVHRLHDGTATPVTPEPATPAGMRWAAMRVLPGGTTFIAVRESHGTDRPRNNRNVHGHEEAVNEVVAVDITTGRTTALVSGPDFVGGPWVSPDGRRLAWLQWDHPDMPWDTAELWVGALAEDATALTDVAHVAGGRGADGTPTSVADARWLDEDRLAFVVDPDGWWNLHVWDDGAVIRWQAEAVESGAPRWVFSVQRIAAVGEDVVVATIDRGVDHLRRLRPDGTHEIIPTPELTAYGEVVSVGDHLVAVVAGSGTPTAVRRIDPATGDDEHLGGPTDAPAARIGATPTPITFATSGSAEAHALHYAPVPPEGVSAPEDELPPLIVLSHGGPTGAARTGLNSGAQYWASRGFAVIDVNYRGSTGYGRAYRDALIGNWGLHDRDDCIAAARHLADRGLVDPDRLIIEGGSAGGYTTLLALCTSDVFAAGGSLFGVADLRALATDTHKFESRYLDSMVGPWPGEEATYVERSPITHVDQLRTPMIVLQGDEDAVVPPAQAELIVAALRERAIPHAYLLFAGEQHGFRQPANIIRALEARLAFYGRVLGFDPADEIELPEYRAG